MKNRFNVILIAAVVVAGVLSGCETVEPGDPYDFETAALYGMVYDHSNQPVSGAAVDLDELPGPTSDLSGRFVLPAVPRGTHSASVSKAGYETLVVPFDFLNKTQVLYAKIWSLDDLVDLGAEQLERRELGAASTTIGRAQVVDRNDPAVRFLAVVLVFRQDRPEEAAELVARLSDQHPDLAYVHLFAADLYEYDLDQLDLAADYLRRFLAVAYDDEVGARLAKIEAGLD